MILWNQLGNLLYVNAMDVEWQLFAVELNEIRESEIESRRVQDVCIRRYFSGFYLKM